MGQIYAHKKKAVAQKLNVSPENANTISALPNSLLLVMQSGQSGNKHNPKLENIMKSRLAMLHHQIPSAENEADQLSSGITSGTPEQVKKSMGERLGADFSSVRFHIGESVSQRADNMGARAWTQGSDVYFGEGGFHPTVAAHELVHTAQQGAVDSTSVNISAPMGGVQMWRFGDFFRGLARIFCGSCHSKTRTKKIKSRPPRENNLLQNEMDFYRNEPSSPTQQRNETGNNDNPLLMPNENQMDLDKAGEDIPKRPPRKNYFLQNEMNNELLSPKQQHNDTDDSENQMSLYEAEENLPIQQHNAIGKEDENPFYMPSEDQIGLGRKGILRSNQSTTGAGKINWDSTAQTLQATLQATLQNQFRPCYLLKDEEILNKINTIYKGKSGEKGVNMLDICSVAFSTETGLWDPKKLPKTQSKIIKPLAKCADQSAKLNSSIVNMPDKANQSITRLADILMENIDILDKDDLGVDHMFQNFRKDNLDVSQSVQNELKNKLDKNKNIIKNSTGVKLKRSYQKDNNNIQQEIVANQDQQEHLNENITRLRKDYIEDVGAKNAVALENLLTAFPKMFDKKKTERMREYFIKSQKVSPRVLQDIAADNNNQPIIRDKEKKKVRWNEDTKIRLVDMSEDTHNVQDGYFMNELLEAKPDFFTEAYHDTYEDTEEKYNDTNNKTGKIMDNPRKKEVHCKKTKELEEQQSSLLRKYSTRSASVSQDPGKEQQDKEKGKLSPELRKKAYSFIQDLGKEQLTKKRGESTGSPQRLQEEKTNFKRKIIEELQRKKKRERSSLLQNPNDLFIPQNEDKAQ